VKIVIDIQGAQTDSRFRGIGRYTMALAQALVRNRGQHDVVLVLNGLFDRSREPIREAFRGVLPPENILVWVAPGPVGVHDPANQGRQEIASVMREVFIASLMPDAVLVSSFFEGYVDNAVTSVGQFSGDVISCVIAYDLIPLLNPLQYLDPHPDYACFYKSKVQQFKQADVFLAISESSRLETLAHLGIEPFRTANISAACETFFKPIIISPEQQQSRMAKWGLTKPFILYTGGADERKNLPRLIEAFALLPEETRSLYQLLFAGKLSQSQQSDLIAIAKKHGVVESDLRFTGFLTDEELVIAYNLCQLFVFPSWHEGFGLPPLESMACGAPTIAGNTSSLPEVMGWQEALFDPFDVNSMVQKMHQSLSDPAFRQQLIAHAHEQSKKFTWDASARKALLAMESAVKRRQPAKATPRTRLSPSGKTPKALLELAARLLKKNNMLSDQDINTLAASMASNEYQLSLHMKINTNQTTFS
jgi:glycosyltransferase involved in cell wall biosynthesis